MITTALLVILGLVTAWVIFNLLSYRNFRNSLPRAQDIGRRIVTWGELILPTLRNISIATRNFIRQTYHRHAQEGFTFWSVILVAVVAVICVMSVNAEFGFAQFTLSDSLGETPDSATTFFGFRLSAVLAALIVTIAILAGLIWLEDFGAEETRTAITEENTELAPTHGATTNTRQAEIKRRTKNYVLKTVAINVLAVIAIFQAFLGFERGTELILASTFETQILGNAQAVGASSNLAVSLLNAFLGLLMPFITAFTARDLLTFITWLLASVIAMLLFLALWLPTWVLNGAVVRYQQQHGLPVVVSNENEPAQRNQGEQPVTPPNPPGESPDEQAFNERYEEDQEELNERREAERRRREQANSNPFGT